MKLVQWLIKTVLAAAIMAGVSVATTWTVVNSYVQQLLAQYGMQDAVKPVSLSGLLSPMSSAKQQDQGDSAALPVSGDVLGNENEGTGQPAGADAEPAEDWPVPDNALPVMGQVSQEIYISSDDLNATKDRISDEDRMAIFAMLVSKLPPDEVGAISRLMEDGLTGEEMVEVSAILQRYLSPEQFTELVEILQKY